MGMRVHKIFLILILILIPNPPGMVESLYIHIPFCHRICPYCAFFKHTPGSTDMRGFVQAVAREARLRLPAGFAPRTVYFGGGTPSMLSPTHMERLVAGLREAADFSWVEEWSFEANPATFTLAKVRQWRELGITRVSLGVQSFEPHLLQLLGREHTPADVAESVQMLQEAGMPHINIDLMFALPGQTAQEWEHTLREAVRLGVDHISAYSLTLEEGMPFHLQYAGSGDDERDAALFELAEDILTAAGFRHYEISNYARTGGESLHNLACWQGRDYIGLGPGACGTVDGTRYENAGDTAAYTAALAQGELPPGTAEKLSAEARRTELLGLMLRTDTGLPAAMLRAQDVEFVSMLEREGLARRGGDGALLLTRRGRLVADEIAVGLL